MKHEFDNGRRINLRQLRASIQRPIKVEREPHTVTEFIGGRETVQKYGLVLDIDTAGAPVEEVAAITALLDAHDPLDTDQEEAEAEKLLLQDAEQAPHLRRRILNLLDNDTFRNKVKQKLGIA